MKYNVLCSTRDMSHEDWLQYRRQGVGGSDAAAICGFNPWKSPVAVYLDKINSEHTPDKEVNLAMKIGSDLEDYVARLFCEQTGKKVFRRNAILQHVEYPFMLANLDRRVVGENAFLECKVTNILNSSDWSDGIPLHMEFQLHHYIAVTGASHCYIAALIGNRELVIKRVERDEEVIKMLIKEESEFWHKVENRIMPDPDGSGAYSEYILNKYPQSISNSIELPGCEDLIVQYDSLKDKQNDLKTQLDKVKQEIQLQMGAAEKAYIGDRKISWKSQISNRLDSRRLKKEKPDIYGEYLKESKTRPFRVS